MINILSAREASGAAHIYLPKPRSFVWQAYQMEREAGSECVEIVSRCIFPLARVQDCWNRDRIWGPSQVEQ